MAGDFKSPANCTPKATFVHVRPFMAGSPARDSQSRAGAASFFCNQNFDHFWKFIFKNGRNPKSPKWLDFGNSKSQILNYPRPSRALARLVQNQRPSEGKFSKIALARFWGLPSPLSQKPPQASSSSELDAWNKNFWKKFQKFLKIFGTKIFQKFWSKNFWIKILSKFLANFGQKFWGPSESEDQTIRLRRLLVPPKVLKSAFRSIFRNNPDPLNIF